MGCPETGGINQQDELMTLYGIRRGLNGSLREN
jgi:hypothetical protein